MSCLWVLVCRLGAPAGLLGHGAPDSRLGLQVRRCSRASARCRLSSMPTGGGTVRCALPQTAATALLQGCTEQQKGVHIFVPVLI